MMLNFLCKNNQLGNVSNAVTVRSCYGRYVCPSVRLSVRLVSHAYAIQDIEIDFASYDIASFFLTSNLMFLSLGVDPERVC